MNQVERAIDLQQDERMRGAADSHDVQDSSRNVSKSRKIRNARRGNLNVNDNSQHNHLSTPVVMLMLGIAVAGLVFGVAGWISGNAGRDAANNANATALAAIQAAQQSATTSASANDKSGQARMEARLAQEDLIMLRAAVKASGIKVETAHDHD